MKWDRMRVRSVTVGFLALLLLASGLTGIGCVPKSQYDDLQSQLSSLQTEYDTTKSQLELAQDQISSLQGQSTELADAKKQVADLQNRLNKLLDINERKYYNFVFRGLPYSTELSIPLRDYIVYKEKARPTDISGYLTMITDPGANTILDDLVRSIIDTSENYDLKESDVINLVGLFCQNLRNTNKDIKTPNDSYPRYPIETLFEDGGDSADTSILAAALISRLNYDVVLFSYDSPKHVALGVKVNVAGIGWEYNAKRYYYLETSGSNWYFGDCPYEYRNIRPDIYPINSQ